MELVILLVVVAALVLVGGGVALTRRRSAGRPLPVPPRTPPVKAPSPPGGRAATSTPTRPRTIDRPPAAPSDSPTALDDTVVDDTVLDDTLIDETLVDDTAPPVVEIGPKPSFRDRLGKARGLLAGYLTGIRARGVDAETWEELEEALIRADVGVEETTTLLDGLRATAKAQGIKEPDALLDAFKQQLVTGLGGKDRTLRVEPGRTNVWLFVGVNGVGKTTTIGKVARQQQVEGRRVLMAAGDTFRAAAAEQLQTWAERSAAEFVRGDEGADPSAVIFDGVQRAASRGIELVLADTAGRLHTKSNLMDELRKVRRVAGKEPGHVTEVLLVLDAVTGQNGLVQAKEFTEAVEVTGVVLTKLDGSAKGGIVLAIESRLGIPVKLVGLGEGVEDLVAFDPDEFVDALFSA